MKQFTVGVESKAEKISRICLKKQKQKKNELKRKGKRIREPVEVAKYPKISSRKKTQRKQRGGNEQQSFKKERTCNQNDRACGVPEMGEGNTPTARQTMRNFRVIERKRRPYRLSERNNRPHTKNQK